MKVHTHLKLIKRILNKTKLTYLDYTKIFDILNEIQAHMIKDSIYGKIQYIDNLKLLLNKIYIKSIDKKIYQEKIFELIDNIIDFEKNEDVLEIIKEFEKFQYYYIYFKLDSNTPYFYLSRKNIKLYLEHFGKVYNYTPYILDDDRCNFFLINYAVLKEHDIENILKDLKEHDIAITSIDYFLFKNIWNIKYIYDIKFKHDEEIKYIKDKIKNEYITNFEYKKIKIFESLVESYIVVDSEEKLFESIKKIKDNKILLICEKHINNRDIKIFLINGINKDNIEQIKNRIEILFYDKNISTIYYNNSDYLGEQFLKYLYNKYNIISLKYK